MQVHSPESVGMSSKRLERLSARLEEAVKGDQLPGMMTVIQRKGKVVQFGMYGHADIEAQRPMHEDALFRIYSMTKPIISIALMMLYEEGKCLLDEPVSKYIPAFAKTKVFRDTGALQFVYEDQDPPMSIYHLLNHTAGLSYGWFFDHPVEGMYREVVPKLFKREDSLETVVNMIAELPLLFQPGSQWRYSYATDVLALVVQVIAGQPLGDFLRERIFEPLGMIDTAFHVTEDKLPRLAQVYFSDKLYNPKPIPPQEVGLIGDITTPTNCPSGGAGLISTINDYLAFCNFLLAKGKTPEGEPLISRKSLELMTQNHIPESYLPLRLGDTRLDFGFGLGFRVQHRLGIAHALSSAGEYGWAGAAKTYFWVDPVEEFTGVLMTQHFPMAEYPFRDLFKQLAYQAIVD